MIVFKKGIRVKTVYGEWVTVRSIRGNVVTVYENGARYVHIDKLLLSTARKSD